MKTILKWILVGILILLPTMAAAPATKAQTPPAEEFFGLMVVDADQQRPEVIWNETAAAAALEIANSAVSRGVCNFEASPRTPNEILNAVGYLSGYGPGNFVASIGCGWSTADGAWQGLRGTHLLANGEDGEFRRAQTQVGIAYAVGSPYGHVWVALTIHPVDVRYLYLPTMFN